MMRRVETPEPQGRPRTLPTLLAFVVGFGVLAWLATGGFSQIFQAPTTTPSPIGRTSPSPSQTLTDSVLNGVTCAGAGDCWAVGFSGNSTVAKQPLFEHYTGSNWTIVRAPNPSAGYLNGVTCASAGDCWAVGSAGISSDGPPLIEHYTGSRWAVVSTLNLNPDFIPTPGVLNGVACVSPGDCWAVGFSGNTLQLIEHFTGTVWTIVTPNPGLYPHPSRGLLNGVACASAGGCWAVGVTPIAGNALIEHYTGSNWSLASTPNPSTGLSGVTCVSAGDCWAAGGLLSTGDSPPLIEHDAGSSWAIVSTPSPSPGVLTGVTCTSPRDCWAVGNTFNIQGDQPLIERFVGSSWAIVSTANPSPGFANPSSSYLKGVACTSPGDCWAVGNTLNIQGDQPLIEHFVGSSWAIVSTANPN
jgi:hypothetical protein